VLACRVFPNGWYLSDNILPQSGRRVYENETNGSAKAKLQTCRLLCLVVEGPFSLAVRLASLKNPETRCKGLN
jgi:hypothetical protein